MEEIQCIDDRGMVRKRKRVSVGERERERVREKEQWEGKWISQFGRYGVSGCFAANVEKIK